MNDHEMYGTSADPNAHIAIHEVRLLTNDLAAQRQFYAERLGLPVAAATVAELTLQVGAARLVFTAAPEERRGAYHVAFNIPENQFDGAKRWLAARTPLVRNSDGRDEFAFAGWNAHAVYCYDPDGNIIELIARHALPNAAPPPFTTASLLTISEVGLVVDDVPAMVARLQADLGVTVYAGAGNADFAAVGDEHGLLIVVRQGRVWFPASGGSAAVALPLTVVLSDAAGRRRMLSGPPYAIAG